MTSPLPGHGCRTVSQELRPNGASSAGAGSRALFPDRRQRRQRRGNNIRHRPAGTLDPAARPPTPPARQGRGQPLKYRARRRAPLPYRNHQLAAVRHHQPADGHAGFAGSRPATTPTTRSIIAGSPAVTTSASPCCWPTPAIDVQPRRHPAPPSTDWPWWPYWQAPTSCRPISSTTPLAFSLLVPRPVPASAGADRQRHAQLHDRG